jgi:type IV secretory pathway TrbL component
VAATPSAGFLDFLGKVVPGVKIAQDLAHQILGATRAAAAASAAAQAASASARSATSRSASARADSFLVERAYRGQGTPRGYISHDSIQGQKPLLYRQMKDGKEQLVETHTRVRRRKQPAAPQGTEAKSAARR